MSKNNYEKVFMTDLDGTLIYSSNYTIKANTIMVEEHDGYQSYMNEKLYSSLPLDNCFIKLIPITTRTLEQYKRINLPIIPDYALVLNGAVLLENGIVNNEWTDETRKLIADEKSEVDKAYGLLQAKQDICPLKTLKYLDDFFLFMKTDFEEKTVNLLKNNLDLSKVNVYRKKSKIYVIPKSLDKGVSANRLKEYIGAKYVISAGDSDIDKSLLDMADENISCETLKEEGVYCHE